MSSHMSVARTTPPAPPALRGATLTAPKLLPVCCACGLIRAETRSSVRRERWISPRTYRQIYGVNSTTLALTHTYCLKCFTKVQEEVRQLLQKIGTPA